MKITIKRVGAVLLAVMILASAAVGVNAAYATMIDFGSGYATGGISGKITYIGSGDTYNTWSELLTFWALDWFEADYTYTFTYRTTLSPVVSDDYLPTLSAVSFTTSRPVYYNQLGTGTRNAYKKVTKDGDQYVFTVKINPGLEDELPQKPLFVMLAWYAGGNNGYKMTTGSWGWSCEYDPGGSKLTDEILSDIRDQLHAGDDYTPPSDAASSLDSGVSSINSAEGELTGKSSSLMDSVSEEWTANKNTAKTFLTTIQPTAVQVKNFYTTLTTALPDEVKALFAIIPLLLFIGYLLGRVK